MIPGASEWIYAAKKLAKVGKNWKSTNALGYHYGGIKELGTGDIVQPTVLQKKRLRSFKFTAEQSIIL